MANITACMSSKTDNWATPQDFFDKLNEEFHFTLDPCADSKNHKCDLFFTKEQNGLNQDWGDIQFSVIHHMVEKFQNGLNIVMNNQKKIKLQL